MEEEIKIEDKKKKDLATKIENNYMKQSINTESAFIIFTCVTCKKAQAFSKAKEDINHARKLAKEEGWLFLNNRSCCSVSCYNKFYLYVEDKKTKDKKAWVETVPNFNSKNRR